MTGCEAGVVPTQTRQPRRTRQFALPRRPSPRYGAGGDDYRKFILRPPICNRGMDTTIGLYDDADPNSPVAPPATGLFLGPIRRPHAALDTLPAPIVCRVLKHARAQGRRSPRRTQVAGETGPGGRSGGTAAEILPTDVPTSATVQAGCYGVRPGLPASSLIVCHSRQWDAASIRRISFQACSTFSACCGVGSLA